MDNRTQEEQEFIESLELGEEFPIISANDMKIFKQKLKEIMQKNSCNKQKHSLRYK